MVWFILLLLGLISGSFVNALTWRLHEQDLEKSKKSPSSSKIGKLSIINARSICPNCEHVLNASDLIPIFSYTILRGKCRYCKKPISIQYPLIELLAVVLFLASYGLWPTTIRGMQIALFILWLLTLIGLISLFIYDIKWKLLPSRIIYPLSVVTFIFAVLNVVSSNNKLTSLLDTSLAVIVGGGVFYVIYQMSNGKWIGGGDVRLGFVLGLIAGTPSRSILFIFLASIIGSIISVPLLLSKKLKRTSVVPFGPMLISAIFIVQLFGSNILNWYHNLIFRM